MSESTSSTGPGSQMSITRVFDAPRELLWKTWTEPEHFHHWFGVPPMTAPVDRISLDPRPGGRFSATMVSEEDGSEQPFHGHYQEVEEPERIVFAFDDESDPENKNQEIVTVTLKDLGGKTEVTLTQVGHMPEDEYQNLVDGYASFFDRLEEHLAEGK